MMRRRSLSSRPSLAAAVIFGGISMACSGPTKGGSEKPKTTPEAREAQPVPAAEATASKPARAETPEAREPEPPRPPQIVELEVPAGTVLELELLSALDSSVNRVGDEIQAKTLAPLYVNGELALAAGALVEGRVTEVKASGRVKGRAKLGFTFDRLKTKTGLETIHTSYVEQEAASGKKKDAAVVGGAAGVGAIVGAIIGGKKGAAIGATVGGAGGTGVVLSTKGAEIRLPVGAQVNVRLNDPVVLQVS